MLISDPLQQSAQPVRVNSGAGTQPLRSEFVQGAAASRWRRRIRAASRHDWSAALLCLVLDVSTWVSIYGFASYLRGDAYYAAPLQFLVVTVTQLAVFIGALFIIGGYDRNTNTRTLSYTTEHVLALTGALVVSAVLIYSAAAYDDTMKPSRGVLLLSFLAFLPVSIMYRRVIWKLLAQSTAKRAFLVVGTGEMAAEFYRAYVNSPNRQRLEFVDLKREVVGQHIAGPGSPTIESDIATKLANLNERYSGVIIAERLDQLQPELLERLVRTQFESSRVYTLEGFYEAHWKYVPVQSIDPFWPLQMGFQLARMSPYHYLKRLFDIVVAGAALVICLPLIEVITILIWWQNGRPALFRQERVGREGQLFTIYKFRTMRHPTENAERGTRKADTGESSAIGNSQFALIDEDIYTRANDPRITKLGHYLRKLRLDELPQLWNVLRGDMSLIGPRAEWIRCAERYEKKIPFYHFRHLVKPGITGWAQVNYPYGESEQDAIEKLKYDLYYIRRYSLKLDVMIVFKTVYTMLFGKGR